MRLKGTDELSKVNTIKIGYKTYRIEKPLEIKEISAEYYGIASHENATITIADKLEQHDKNHVFIHELLHAICARFQMRELNEEEQTLDLLASGIYEAIIDNPHIFLMEDI